MLRAAVDTNIAVSGFISGFDNSAAFQVLENLRAGSFQLITTKDVIEELRAVLKLPEIQKRHGRSIEMIHAFCNSLLIKANVFAPYPAVAKSLARDLSDAKFLDLCLASDADYFVTRDRRHLLRLKKIGRTRIVTPHKFLLALKKYNESK